MMIKFNRYTLVLQVINTIQLPSYKGSTFRGAFGVAFKRIVCALRRQECSDCLLSNKCVYSYIFESKPEEKVHIFGKVATIPRPYIIEPPDETKSVYEPGEEIKFNLILIGNANEYLPYFIYTFNELGKAGIGKHRGKFTLKEVLVSPQKVIFSKDTGRLSTITPMVIDLSRSVQDALNQTYKNSLSTSSLTLRFLTPTRIKYNRTLTKDLEFHILTRQLLRRLFLLWYFHTSRDGLNLDDIKGYHRNLINLASDIKIIKNNLIWHDWERYSHRQKVKMKLGGFLGEISYRGNIQPFIPFLKAGEYLHIGKGTTFGLGKYQIL